jgi:D-alanyl-D-alanine carboxypeptidase/D-alanyl-D-alanine-endopeptidase (penicillin-binding protein 4)
MMLCLSPARLRAVLIAAFVAAVLSPVRLAAQQAPSAALDSLVTTRLRPIMTRPEFRHARFGIEFFSLDDQRPVYALNAEELFVAASTTKLLTTGTALHLLGADHRFRTRAARSQVI